MNLSTSTYLIPPIPKEIDRRIVAAFLFIAIFVLSIGFRQREIGDTSLDFQNGFKLITWISIFLISLLYFKEIANLFHSLAGSALLILAGLALISSLWSDVQLYSFASALGFAAYLGLAALSAQYLNDDAFFRLTQRSLLLFVLIGLIGSIFFPQVTWQEPSVEETVFRLQGFASNSNNFGRISAILILLGLGSFKLSYTPKIEFLLSFFVGVSGLLLSGCRTGLIAAICACFLVSLRYYQFSRLILGSIFIVFPFAMVAFAYGFDINLLFKAISRTGLESEIFTLTGRTEIWSSALDLIRQHPLLGWGYNGTEERLALSMEEAFNGSPVNAHQMFLQLILGFGVIGLIPAILLFLSRLRYVFVDPNPLRDLISGFIFLNGITEVDLFATPLLTNIIFFRILLTDHLAMKEFR